MHTALVIAAAALLLISPIITAFALFAISAARKNNIGEKL